MILNKELIDRFDRRIHNFQEYLRREDQSSDREDYFSKTARRGTTPAACRGLARLRRMYIRERYLCSKVCTESSRARCCSLNSALIKLENLCSAEQEDEQKGGAQRTDRDGEKREQKCKEYSIERERKRERERGGERESGLCLTW